MSSSICTAASTILITNLETINMMIKVAVTHAVFLFISSQKISMNLLHDIARYMDCLSGSIPSHLTMIFGQKKPGYLYLGTFILSNFYANIKRYILLAVQFANGLIRNPYR